MTLLSTSDSLTASAPSGKLSWFQTGSGAARAYSVVSLGRSYIPTESTQELKFCSFGLLHRIPPIPSDRQPGAIPPELLDSAEFEEQTLYVPADAMSDQLDLEFHSDVHDQQQHFLPPPHTHDYSYTYSNRGTPLARQSPSSTIPEEYEGTERHSQSSRSSQDLHHTNDRNNHHHHRVHDRGRDHGRHNHRVGTLPTSRRSATPRSVTPDIHSNGDSRS